MTDFRRLTDMIIETDDEREVNTFLMSESKIDELFAKVGNEQAMNYLIKFEEYLSDHDVYMFRGWEDAKIVKAPKIAKFWCEFDVLVSSKTDLRALKRVTNDKEGQNEVNVSDLENGAKLINFKILKKYFDEIDERNDKKIQELAKDDMGNAV